MTDPVYRKSSYSNNGDCVELAATPDGVAVRDSKDPDGPILTFSTAEMSAFIQGIKAGEFDNLA